MNARLIASVLLVLTVSTPLAISAQASAPETALYLVFDGAFALRVPDPAISWTIAERDDGSEVRILHPTGEVFAAVRLNAPIIEPGRILELPIDFFSRANADATLASTDSGSCQTGSLGMVVCADISYGGGSSPIWHQGSVENVPSNHYCQSGVGCLLIQGCTHVSCPNEAWFWVQPTATYASVCWTWRAWTYVNGRATYAGVSPATPDVFPTWWTTC